MSDFRKDWKPSRTPTASEQLAGRVDELRSTLRVQDPGLVAARSGSSWLLLGPGRGEMHLPLWGKACILCWLWVLVVAAVLGALVGLALIVAGRGSSRTAHPFGSFLAFAVLVWLYLPSVWMPPLLLR